MAFDWRTMENELSLEEIIQSSMSVEDPVEDNFDTGAAEDSDEVTVDDLIAGLVDGDDEPVEDEEGVETDSDLSETYQVKIDGEVVDVTLKEALAGYQRQADYTRKAQALAAEREEFQESIAEFSDTVETLETLDAAWEENPVTVLTHFLTNTDNPTHSLALVIKEAASAGILERDFLEMFGITSDVQKAWAKEGEVDSLRRKVSATEKSEAQQKQEVLYEAEVQKALAEYESQIDDILADEGLKKITVAQRNAFRQKLASYASDNELTNLKAAYKALKYEESQKKRAVTVKTKERAAQKKNVSAVGRSGASAAGSAPIVDSNDLEAVIRQAMDEAKSSRS